MLAENSRFGNILDRFSEMGSDLVRKLVGDHACGCQEALPPLIYHLPTTTANIGSQHWKHYWFFAISEIRNNQ